MTDNPFVRVVRGVDRRVQVAGTEATAAAPAPAGSAQVGANDSNNDWHAYGILGVTPLGSFRLKP